MVEEVVAVPAEPDRSTEYATRSVASPKRARVPLPRLLSVPTFLLLWQLGHWLGLLDPRFYSSPIDIAIAGIDVVSDDMFLTHSLITLTELTLGFAIGASLAIVLGFLMGYFRWVGALVDPIAMSFYAMPRLAIYPLLVVWFGLGMSSKVVMVTLGTLFQVLINTVTGVRTVDKNLVDAGRAFGANSLFIAARVVLPGAMPAVMTGLRQGVSQAIIAVITAEMLFATAGLGYLIIQFGQAFRTDALLFLILLVAVVAYSTITGFTRLESYLSPWRSSVQRIR